MSDPAALVAAMMPRFADEPALHVHKLDPMRRAALVLVMAEADYRRESFLDDRILERVRAGAWTPASALLDLIPAPSQAPHFIFHQGHTGSTLISRLLDGLGALGLREPAVLTELAALHDDLDQPEAQWSRAEWDRFARFTLHAWARTFTPGAPAIVKSTSHAQRIGLELLNAAPQARGVTLYMRAEPYLATLLAGANSAADINGFAQQRMRRLVRAFGDVSQPLHALSLGETAALTWLVERAAQVELRGPRVLDIDFDDFLAAPQAPLSRIAAHFGLVADSNAIAAVLAGPTMTRYSKDPSQSYSAQRRQSTLTIARATHAEEIRKGLAWLERIGAQSADAARVIA